MQKLELAAQTLVRSTSGRCDAHAAFVLFFLHFHSNRAGLCGRPLLSLKVGINPRCHLVPHSASTLP